MQVGNFTQFASLVHVSIEESEYVIFQVAMIILLLTYIIYPLPRRSYDIGAYLALAIEFLNAFDIMDMLGDIAFIRNYDVGWRSIYYLSMGISVLLLSFPINIEDDFVDFPRYFFDLAARVMRSRKERKNVVTGAKVNTGFHVEVKDGSAEVDCICVLKKGDMNDGSEIQKSGREKHQTQESEVNRAGEEIVFKTQRPGNEELCAADRGHNIESKLKRKTTRVEPICETWKRFAKTAATIIFTDVMFATIRLKIMIEEHSVDHGFNMVVKNLILAILHFLYVLKHTKTITMLYKS